VRRTRPYSARKHGEAHHRHRLRGLAPHRPHALGAALEVAAEFVRELLFKGRFEGGAEHHRPERHVRRCDHRAECQQDDRSGNEEGQEGNRFAEREQPTISGVRALWASIRRAPAIAFTAWFEAAGPRGVARIAYSLSVSSSKVLFGARNEALPILARRKSRTDHTRRPQGLSCSNSKPSRRLGADVPLRAHPDHSGQQGEISEAGVKSPVISHGCLRGIRTRRA
jgi:hypothetical protein